MLYVSPPPSSIAENTISWPSNDTSIAMMSAFGQSPVPNGVIGSTSPPPDSVFMPMMFALFGSTLNELYWKTSPTLVRFGRLMNAI
jgi:hypothetical protein